MTFKLTSNVNIVIRIEDGACIPNDPNNRDWQAYQAFLAGGGVPQPADPPLPAQLDPHLLMMGVLTLLVSKGILVKADFPAPLLAGINQMRTQYNLPQF